MGIHEGMLPDRIGHIKQWLSETTQTACAVEVGRVNEKILRVQEMSDLKDGIERSITVEIQRMSARGLELVGYHVSLEDINPRKPSAGFEVQSWLILSEGIVIKSARIVIAP